jgi:hypothetical protein
LRKVLEEALEKERCQTLTAIMQADGEIEDFGFFAEVAPLKNAHEYLVLLTNKGQDFADARFCLTLPIARGGGGKIGFDQDRANRGGVCRAAWTDKTA